MRFLYFGIYDPDFSRNRIYMQALRKAGHEVTECRESSSGLLKYVRLVQHLRSLKGSYDVIIVGYPGHVVVPLARLFGATPVVSDLLGSLSDAAENTYDAGFFVRGWFSWVDRLAIACSDVVLVDSGEQKKYMERRYGSGKKYQVVYTGADEEVFKARGERDSVPAELFVVLFRGRLIPQSGIMHILDAAERLESDKYFLFRIIGYGPLLDAVRERVRGLSNVELISEHISFAEMRRLMLDADVSLGQFGDNPRSDRNIPHKAFESISMGIPYLTARVPGIAELLEDEISCLMVPLENSGAIRAGLERLRDDRSIGKRLAQKARAVYESRASARAISSKITGVALSCIEAKKKVTSRYFQWFSRREATALLVLVLVFVGVRMPGLSLPYHQDEWKMAEIMRSHIVGGLAAHPPLSELTYRWTADIVGADNMRVTPLFFGVASLLLLYAVVRRRAGGVAALIAAGLYTISTYSVFSSLMIDVDGALLATILLSAVYAYDRFVSSESFRSSVRWFLLAAVACVVGLLTKLSAVLIAGALISDYAWERRKFITPRILWYGLLGAIGAFAISILGVIFLRAIVPGFDVQEIIIHILYYVDFSDRNHFQTAIQASKAVMYLSPLLVAPLLLLTSTVFSQMRIFFTYLLLALVFFFVIFDFSHGALDKYLLLTVAPLSGIAGAILASRLAGLRKRDVHLGLFLGVPLSIILFALNFLPHDVVPLYPKGAWISRVLSGDWTVLFPFTGGNGPVGVYVSILFIGTSFIVSAILVLLSWWKKAGQAYLVVLVLVGVAYTAVFTEEFVLGEINGSASKVLSRSIAFIADDTSIKSVFTHADAGAYELIGISKYAGRFYAVPEYAEGHRARFKAHNGYYLVVNVPLLDPDGFYARYFATCTSVFHTSSGRIQSDVYNCAGHDPYVIK